MEITEAQRAAAAAIKATAIRERGANLHGQLIGLQGQLERAERGRARGDKSLGAGVERLRERVAEASAAIEEHNRRFGIQ